MGMYSAVTGGGDERNIGISRRIMGSIHSRNNPSKLRPDMALRDSTGYGLARAQNAALGRAPWDDNAQAGDFVGHKGGGAAAGAAEMGKFAREKEDTANMLASRRKSLTRLDPDRPSRSTVRGAKADAKEAGKFASAAAGSPRVMGIQPNDEAERDPYGNTNKTYVAQNPLEQTPGPVMRGAVLPAARAAGKAVGKVKKALGK